MIWYVDTSALVKRYVVESHSELVLDAEHPLVVSELARLELASALWKRGRTDARLADTVPVLLDAFEVDIAGWGEQPPVVQLVRLDARVMDVARRLVARHELGSLDALHLATAEVVRVQVDSAVAMVAFDTRLRAAAAGEDFPLVPPLLN